MLKKLYTKLLNKYNCMHEFIKEDVVNENIDKDCIFNILFKNGSNIQNIPDNCSIRGKRSSIMWVAYEDKKYNKYLKRVKNRQKLYDKLRKIGR